MDYIKKYANGKLKRAKISGRVLISFGISLLIIVLIFVLEQIRVFVENPDTFSLQFTNISFAVLLGLGNSIFSWARALDKTNFESQMPGLNRIGATCIIASMGMIFISLFTYILFNGILLSAAEDNGIVKLLVAVRIILLVFVLVLICSILRKIILVAWKVLVAGYFSQPV